MFVFWRSRSGRVFSCVLLAAFASGCANLKALTSAPAKGPQAAPVAAGAASSPFAATSERKADPAPFKPFDDVIKGAVRQDGFVPVWRKHEKVWLEIAPTLLDQPLLLSVNIAASVGERGLYGSQMGPAWLASFRRIGESQVQLIALNTHYSADNGSMRAAIEQGFSHSLLGSAAVVSAPHKTSQAVLIDAAFLLSDMPGYSTRLESAFRLPFGIDRANSFFEKINVGDELTSLNARIHFATSRIPAPPLRAGGDPTPPPPKSTPDPRSLFVAYVYNFLKPPAEPMARRRTDPRLGHFFDVVTDLSSDLKPNPRMHLVKRWRLDKQDPQAAMSEPRQPIVFWLDKNIPPRYRPAVEAGVLEWNKAFEKIGFRNALQVRQQPDDAEWDTMDARHASIRWFVGADVGFAIGPSRSDPRTGEIFDADIGMSDVFGRGARRFIVEDVGRQQSRPHIDGHGGVVHGAGMPWERGGVEACNLMQEAAAEMNFVLDVLEARGDIEPDSPQAEAFVHAVIKDTIMHEVGHALGLKHNFKASTVVKREQLRDSSFTEKYGISGSVMDYNSYNLPLRGEAAATINNTTIGPYDYWAIEYAYKPIDPADEEKELTKIAARAVTDPLLSYADDADSNGVGGSEGIDPLANAFDLGDDPLDFHRKRLQLSRELWQRVQQRQPQPGDDAQRQRRVMFSGFRQLGRAADLVGKYVGGMHAVRDLPGTSERRAFTPVDPAKQRDALRFLADGLFKTDSFQFEPEFLANLAPDYNEWDRSGPVSVPGAVLQIQSVVLNRLLSAGTATRLLDLPMYLPKSERRDLISLAEVYSTLQDSIWSELRSGDDIAQLRRNLQREHLKRMQVMLTKGSSSLPPDALSLMRMNAVDLQRDLQKATRRKSLSVEARAHLQDSLALLNEALKASMTRG
ncbi:zinc-dependent metalloprotease [Piscinibacter sakaiensis]|uniref:zinc-dependent metalloprotease n=1 Tax=Piscinibacter sakaiensis TaxID=1547922 RepID=UPI003AAB43D0